MASNPPVAVYDACVLYPFHLRNVLIQCAFDGLVEARWTDEIHDEWIRHLVPELRLPDPDDRHVLAAAIAGKAAYIVTWNLKDFPTKDLAYYGVTSQSPDDFLTGLHATFPDALISSIKRARHNLRKTMPSVDAFIDGLQQSGLKTFPVLLRQSIDGLI